MDRIEKGTDARRSTLRHETRIFKRGKRNKREKLMESVEIPIEGTNGWILRGLQEEIWRKL